MMLAKHPTWPARQRGGYTLVEMLVAAGVSLMIMVILTGAFQAGMDTFRKLRAQGNMQERLRMARTALCDDLSSPHFENAAGDSGWDKQDYVSFQDMRPLVDGGSWSPPSDGFFRIWQANEAAGSYTGWQPNDTPLPFIPEGADSSGMFFTRARTHAFHFTVRRRGGGPENMYRTSDFMTSPATAPWRQVNPPQAGLVWPTNFINPVDYRGQPDPVGSTNPFVTQWAEVAWFLVPNGSSAGSSTPLFNLYRRQ
ncbi:MAG: PilW family protein, partial [Gemmataceae bacterium]